MKLDWLTKILLAGICVLLGVLVFERGGGVNEAKAQAPEVGNAFVGVDVIPYGKSGFILFDRATGDVCAYDQALTKGFPFEKIGTAGRIQKVGAPVVQMP